MGENNILSIDTRASIHGDYPWEFVHFENMYNLIGSNYSVFLDHHGTFGLKLFMVIYIVKNGIQVPSFHLFEELSPDKVGLMVLFCRDSPLQESGKVGH